jgi:pyruvate dehydrogenase E2 component (dihydrolipoamide acetyltransferase)
VAIPITVPRLGWTMEQGTFLAWRKQEGEAVRPGEPLFELEGDKAAQEVEALDGGILRIPPDAPRPGDTVPVGAVLGYLLAAGEAPPWEQTPAAAPRLAPVPAVAAGTTDRAPAPAAEAAARQAISPRARRVARELDVEWAHLRGTGRTGRIRERDVRAAACGERPAVGRVVPLTPVRRLIAERMLAGAHAAAPVTLTTRADATNLVNLRGQFKAAAAAGEPVPGYTDFLVKLAAAALREHPHLNASWVEDGIRLHEAIHVGIAVDAEAGLLVPVVRDVPALSLRQVAARSRELIELARARRLTAEQMQGGTFTVSNLGAYGIDAFTPILNLPQCAVLGVGRIRREPAVHENQIVPRDVLTLSLTFDHRVVDGGPAARFLDTLRRSVEQPAPYLIA